MDLFFVLSGFFIGGQLWKELQKDRDISIRRFIVRRGLRIWPLFFFVFACVFAIYWPEAATKQYGWTDLVFLTNYLNHGIVGGGWSLCTEEQFYIVTPLLLCLFARNKDLKVIRPWLWGLLALIPAIRAAIWIHHTGHFFYHDPDLFATMYYKFHTHCDGLIIGLIISNLWISRNKPKSSAKKAALIVVGGGVVLILLRELQHEVFIFTGLAVFFGSLVWFGLTSRSAWFRSRLFYWISRLSFGMYLNHAYLIGPTVNGIVPHFQFLPQSSIQAQLLGTLILTGLSAALATVTFCLVEHPFLQLRMLLLEPNRENAVV